MNVLKLIPLPFCQTSVSILVTMNPLLCGGGGLGLVDGEVADAPATAGGGDDTVAVVVVVVADAPATAAPAKAGLQL